MARKTIVNTAYSWDARNQLAAISGGTSASFQYDPFGRRVSKTIGGTTQYLYDESLNPQKVNGNTVGLLANGSKLVGVSVGISTDNRTVTLSAGTRWPALSLWAC